MGWIHRGGGYYENEETGDRIRGKANLPEGEAPVNASKAFIYACVGNCYAETEHSVEDMGGFDLLTCQECGATVSRNP